MEGNGEELRETGSAWEGLLPSAVAAAHELKAPLALIRQLSLSLEQGGWDEGETRHMLNHITLTSERALRLTADFTRAARLQESLFELGPINAREVCEEIAHELTPLFRAKNRELRVDGSRRPHLVVANRELLARVLVNFSDNALQYADTLMPVTLRAESVGDAYVRVGVRDRGPAVSADVWQTLKRRLGKVPYTLPARPGSSGLGLYLAGQFASAMGAHVGATRHKDGTTFYIDLVPSRQLRLL